MERRDKLLSGLDLSVSRGVEIGPLNKPTVRKDEGAILYVDYTDTDSLRAKYEEDPTVNTEEIVEIDAVWGAQTLAECIGHQRVDYVVSSHVVEHVPDLIAGLEEIESILKPGGSLRLAVPDRRFTFDYLRRESRLCDIVNAYLLKSRTPLPIAILDYFLSVRRVDQQAAWNGKLPAELPRVPGHDLKGGMGVATDQIKNGTYHNIHCWVFTPRSFAELFAEAAAEGLIHFGCEAVYDTEPGQLEFFTVLKQCEDREQTAESWRRAASSVVELKSTSERNAELNAAARAAASDEILSLRLSLAQKEEELSGTKQTLASVLSSRSWRITELLRSLRSAFRR